MRSGLAFVVGCAVLSIGVAPGASAQEIWSGYGFQFIKPDGADWTLEVNQDRITPQTWITRQDAMGLFNIKTEVGYDFDFRTSPANTEWAYDLTNNGNDGKAMVATNHANLNYEPWGDSVNGFPGGVTGLPGVVHLIAEDIYLDLMVTSWISGGDGGFGGFSYVRAVPEPGHLLLGSVALISLWALKIRHTACASDDRS